MLNGNRSRRNVILAGAGRDSTILHYRMTAAATFIYIDADCPDVGNADADGASFIIA